MTKTRSKLVPLETAHLVAVARLVVDLDRHKVALENEIARLTAEPQVRVGAAWCVLPGSRSAILTILGNELTAASAVLGAIRVFTESTPRIGAE